MECSLRKLINIIDQHNVITYKDRLFTEMFTGMSIRGDIFCISKTDKKPNKTAFLKTEKKS